MNCEQNTDKNSVKGNLKNKYQHNSMKMRPVYVEIGSRLQQAK